MNIDIEMLIESFNAIPSTSLRDGTRVGDQSMRFNIIVGLRIPEW